MSTPDLQLRTLFVLDDEGRIVSKREPVASRGPLFAIIRSATRCAWAVRSDISRDLAGELDRLARAEPPALDLRRAPLYADLYVSLVGDRIATGREAASKVRTLDGPAFTFPDSLVQPLDVIAVTDERLLEHNFPGWVPGEIAAGRSPVLAVVADGHPVSVCFCARRSDVAAEAGLETAEAYRGRGFAARVTAAWALAIRAAGLIPLYSTWWSNDASLAVARKLDLVAYASDWTLAEQR